MDRQALCKQITQTQNESERLSRGLQMLYHINPTNNPEDYEKISTDTALLGERITCRLRHLVYDMTEMKKTEYLVAAGEAHGIEIKYDDGIFEIALPRLLPKRKKWDSTEFLLDPLYFTLNDYKRAHHFPLFKHCTICDPDLCDQLNELLASDLCPADYHYLVENDAMTEDGIPVLFAYTCDLYRIKRFNNGLLRHEQRGIIYCFEYQA